MTLVGLLTFYPFWYVFITSFNVGTDTQKGGVYLWFRTFTLENYATAFRNSQIYNSFMISIGRTVLGVALGLFFTALLAYALSVKSLPGRKGINMFFFITTVFSGGMIPYYILLRDLKLTASFWIYILPGIYNFMNMILMRTYFNSTIPDELRESAEMDGASELTTLMRIYVPLAKPIIATLALFIGVGNWNDWFTGAYYVSNQKLYPAATVLQQILNNAMSMVQIKQGQENANLIALISQPTPFSIQMAFVMILTMPIIVVYPFLQKYYVKGVMIGSIKG